MPYVKISANERENRAIVAAIRYGMELHGIKPKSLALTMREDQTTLYRRLNQPENFTLGELRAISTKLHIPLEKLVKGEIT